jgi:hypothetical protein
MELEFKYSTSSQGEDKRLMIKKNAGEDILSFALQVATLNGELNYRYKRKERILMSLQKWK